MIDLTYSVFLLTFIIFVPMNAVVLITGATSGIGRAAAEDIADIIHFVVSRPYHVNIMDLLVFPAAQTTGTMVHKNEG